MVRKIFCAVDALACFSSFLMRSIRLNGLSILPFHTLETVSVVLLLGRVSAFKTESIAYRAIFSVLFLCCLSFFCFYMDGSNDVAHPNARHSIMSKNSPFILPAEEYKRDINPLRDYVHDQVSHLMIMANISREEAQAFVAKQLQPGGEFELKEPQAVYLERDLETGDREEASAPVSEYIATILRDGNIFAPTMTTYHNPTVRMSPLSEFQDANVKSRSKAKKQMFIAGQDEGDESFNYMFFKGSQTTEKLANNAVSGSMISEHNPICNKTGHSSLTSACRQTSAYGNANNERFLASNRHYWSYKITRNNIISIVANTDYSALEQVMTKYSLHYPTIEETMGVIVRSAKLYWNDKRSYAKLQLLVDKLNPLQRAAFVYTGDLYQLKEFNDDFVRNFIRRLIQRVDVVDATPTETIKKWPEDFLNLAKQLCSRFTKGKSLDKVKKENPEGYATVAATTESIAQTLWEYADVVKTLWATDNMPASIAMFPNSLRRVVLVSDTDSTIFTTQDWIMWYCGGIKFDDDYDAVTATMIFLASQSIIHILAKMSANVGIGRDHAFTVEMKNEYKFDVFALTQLGKHYFAYIGCQEGNVYDKFKKEIKGVHLKSSNVPKDVVKQAENMMINIMDTLMKDGKLSALKYLKEVADLERSIVASITRGEFRYLKLTTVNNHESYKNGEDTATWKQYGMWKDVFGPKYGHVTPPPYKGIRISLELDSKTKTQKWLADMRDQTVADAMRKWLLDNNRDKITSMILPLPVVSAKGIPEEIMMAIDTRKIVEKATAMFYLILEALGLYFNHTDLRQLAMDRY